GLRPDGIVLDYDDQPRTRDAWVQAGEPAVAPIVRSTHFWTTRDNVLGKLDASVATWEPGPHFLWITVYPFRFGLQDALGLVEILKTRLGDNLALVTPGQFFGLMREDFVRLAHGRLGEIEENPLASALFRTTLDSARSALREALEQNFWTYPVILVAIVIAAVHRPLGRWMDRAYPTEAPLAGSLVALVLISLAIRTTAAFPLALIGTLLALDTYLRRRPANAPDLAAGLGFGSAIGFLGDFEIVTFTA